MSANSSETQLILIVGLLSVEKAELAATLAGAALQAGQRVTVLDNLARLPVRAEQLPAGVILRRLEGDPVPALHDLGPGLTIALISENLPPDPLFTALADLTHIDIETLALIDSRTCDCFPAIRERLEEYADRTVYYPFEAEAVTGVS